MALRQLQMHSETIKVLTSLVNLLGGNQFNSMRNAFIIAELTYSFISYISWVHHPDQFHYCYCKPNKDETLYQLSADHQTNNETKRVNRVGTL